MIDVVTQPEVGYCSLCIVRLLTALEHSDCKLKAEKKDNYV